MIYAQMAPSHVRICTGGFLVPASALNPVLPSGIKTRKPCHMASSIYAGAHNPGIYAGAQKPCRLAAWRSCRSSLPILCLSKTPGAWHVSDRDTLGKFLARNPVETAFFGVEHWNTLEHVNLQNVFRAFQPYKQGI